MAAIWVPPWARMTSVSSPSARALSTSAAKALHTRSEKTAFGLAVRAGAFAVGVHPGQIIRVVLHLNEIAALKAAEAHLLQVFHLHEPCTREEHLRGLPGAAERGDIDRFRPEIRLPQLGAARGAQGDIPLALIALFGVVGRQAMAQ